VPRLVRHKPFHAVVACACLAALALPVGAAAEDYGSGGAMFVPPPPPPKKAKVVNGLAVAPRSAPWRVKRVIAAGNRIVGKPYRYGGGHILYTSRALDSGYDCSGSVSFALHGGRFLRSPLDSSSFMGWGRSGPGRWITVYTNPGHAYLVVAGLRFDTSMRDDPSRTGPAWSKRLRSSSSFVPRHPRSY
jgi:hypothetical protein